MFQSVNIFSCAKLNLFLKVGPVHIDGFHPLQTVFQSIDLFDKLKLEIIELAATEKSSKNQIEISVVSSRQKNLIPTDKTNLIYKAATLYFRKTGIGKASPPVNLKAELQKSIPVAAGLAGGSSNAAATLYGLNHIFGQRLSEQELLLLAKELGSDVPFCLLGGCMLGTGRGDELTRLKVDERLLFVLVYPPEEVVLSAKEIYKSFDELNIAEQETQSDTSEIEQFIKALLSSGRSISKFMHNSLEEPIVNKCYWAEKAKAAIDSKGFESLVSGSGPTVFTIAPNDAQANILVKKLKEEGFNASIHRSTSEAFQLISES